MGLTSEQERRLDSDPTRHAHVARTVSRLHDVFDWMMKPTEQPRLSVRNTPVTGRYTRSEEVQCPRIGCSAQRNKHFLGRALPT